MIKGVHKWAGNLGVDAGTIQVMDSAFIEKHGGKANASLCHVVDVTPGRYRVTAHFPDTYNGEINFEEIIEVKGNKLVIGDACYNFEGDAWGDLLDATGMLEDSDPQYATIRTGGDGIFDVELTVEPE